MSDVVWVALISAGGAIAAALMTQIMAMRSAAKQAERMAQQELLQWQRNEVHRKQKDAEDKLQDFWRAIVETQDRLLDALYVNSKKSRFSEGSVSTAATRAYAIALVMIPNLLDAARDFCDACSAADSVIHDTEKVHDGAAVAAEWRESFDRVEAAVLEEAARIRQLGTPLAVAPRNE
ncbi:hypothetical protein DZC30_00905 [Comamonas testosteroni]|uniref:DUF2489 domain-containing protein n=1 Tax=Comamonas testosteroni TaxID=285 RepID=A0A373FT29_COMTE|nr:hypothetical protein [Comamonas testosteroni]RGE46997.1 hypothetical protein DZC30_00905 [Comamonas testosteroni]